MCLCVRASDVSRCRCSYPPERCHFQGPAEAPTAEALGHYFSLSPKQTATGGSEM